MGVTIAGMAAFENADAAQVVDAAEKFVSKMDETELISALAQSAHGMPPAVRRALVEAAFDAFRQRGESSEDVAEGAGTTLEAIANDAGAGMDALLQYAQRNAGLLREATMLFVETNPEYVKYLAAPLTQGIERRLQHES